MKKVISFLSMQINTNEKISCFFFFLYQIEKNSFKLALPNAYEDSVTWSAVFTAGGMVNLNKLYNEQIENMSQKT